jgi:palmitoyltransferase
LNSKIGKEMIETFLNEKCSKGYSALHYSAFNGNIDIIENLIENGADYLQKTPKGLNAIHLAAQGDKPEAIILLKDKYKMDLLDVDDNGSTALHWACFAGAEYSFNFLLTWTHNVNMKENSGYTPFHMAVFSGTLSN